MQNDYPVDYIIGFSDFLHCKIDLRFKPLIPRPETEYWVDNVIKKLQPLTNKSFSQNLKVLDIFSGSGCIGLAILKNIAQVKVDFSDKNPRFIKQIKLNLKINKISSQRYRAIPSNVFSKINSKYDYILANPPYMPKDNPDLVTKSVRQFEPKSAVFACENGLYYIKKLLLQSPMHLKKNGIIYLEFHHPQKRAIEKILKKSAFTCWQFYQDQYGFWRYLSAS